MHHTAKNNLSIDTTYLLAADCQSIILFLFIYPLRSSNPHFLSHVVISLCVDYATKTNKRVAGGDNKSRIETKVDLKVSQGMK
jgi:hypothetical protein